MGNCSGGSGGGGGCFAPTARSLSPRVRLDGLVALVTGVSSGGIGFEVALDLARRGARVILAGRSAVRVEETARQIRERAQSEAWPGAAAPPQLATLVIDMADMESIARCVEEQLPRIAPPVDKLHILIHNAGVLCPPPLPPLAASSSSSVAASAASEAASGDGAAAAAGEVPDSSSGCSFSPQGIEVTMATNYVGPWLLTRLLMPLLTRTSEDEWQRANRRHDDDEAKNDDNAAADSSPPPFIARVIHVSSVAHRFSSMMDRSSRVSLRSVFSPTPRYFDGWDAYAHSKLSQLLHARTLGAAWDPRRELQAFSLHPGVVRSDIGRDASCCVKALCNLAGPVCFRNTQQGAAVVVATAIGDPVTMALHSGEYFDSARLFVPDDGSEEDGLAHSRSAWPSPAPARVSTKVRDPQLAANLEEYTDEIVTQWQEQRRRALQLLLSSSSSHVSSRSPSSSSSSSASPFVLPPSSGSSASVSAVLLDSLDASLECDRLIPSSSSSSAPSVQRMSDDPPR